MISDNTPPDILKDIVKNRMSGIPSRYKEYSWIFIFVAPMFCLFVIFTVYPLLASLRYTLYDWNGIGKPTTFVGFKHYLQIANDPFFWNAFKNTFIYALVVVPIQLSAALILALVLNSPSLKFRMFFRAVFFLPIVTSPAIVGIAISLLMISGNETINRFLQDIGWIIRPVDWLGNPHIALWIVIAVGIWIGLGYPLIYFLAALQSIDNELYDAARIDGAGNAALFWHITVPSIKPIILIVFLLLALHSLRVFDIVQVITKGGPYFATDVVSTYIYRYAFPSSGILENESNLGFASAAAFFMSVVVMALSILQITVVRNLKKR